MVAMMASLLVGLTLAVGQSEPGPAPPPAMLGAPVYPAEPSNQLTPAASQAPSLRPDVPRIVSAPASLQSIVVLPQGEAPGRIIYVQEPGKPAPTPQAGGKTGSSGTSNSGSGNGDKKDNSDTTKEEEVHGHFLYRFIKAYCDEFWPKKDRLDCCIYKCPNGNQKEGQNGGQNSGKSDGDKGGKSNGDKGGKSDGDKGSKSDGDKGSKGNGEKTDGHNGGQAEEQEPFRRTMPSPWPSPPFPGSEYQGYPLIGLPEPSTVYPFMKALYGCPCGEEIKESRIKFTGWATTSGNWSTANNSNTPASYWIVPNRYVIDQMVMKLERYPDTVQTDHIDWGFRSVGLYGIDYRYTMAGGWGSAQLLKHNLQYGWDPTEQYFNVYIPGFLGGTDIRVGRWIACPDIETQYSVDNYMASHSLLFTVDTYTQTGIMLTQMINQQWTVQAVLHSGTDMAPWYPGAVATGAFGLRWVSKDNNDAFYTWLNAINSAEFRHFTQYGQPLGHDNFNYIVTTWEHRFNKCIHTKTEAYYMWERNAEVGGTPSAGPPKPIGGGGGDGTLIPGLTQAYGVLNYTMFGITKRDYFTVRNEWYKDESGFRLGARGNYTSHTIGLSHQFNDLFMIRPEIGYYRNWTQPAFDLGAQHGIWIYGFDVTLRF
jgi:hypothetical protein